MEEKKNSKKGVKKGNTTTKKATTNKKSTTTKKTSTKKPVAKKVVENKKTVAKKETVESKKVKAPKVKVAKKDNWFKKMGRKICESFKNFSNKCEQDKPFFIMFIITLILAITVLCLVCFGRIPKTKNGNDVLAKLDGKTITADDLYVELKEQYGVNSLINAIDSFIANKEITSKEDIKEAKDYAKQAVDYYKEYAEYYGVDFETFLAQYIGISGVTDEDSFYNYVFEDYKKTLAVKNYLGESYSDEEVEEYYNENYSKLITVREILIEIEEDNEDAAKERAKEIIDELNKVEDSDKLAEKFEELAYDNSDDSTYADGGLKEKLSKSEVSEEFWKAANKLKNGKYTTEAIKDDYGYHIILKVKETKGESLKKVENEIRAKLAEEALNTDSTLQVTYWDKLREKYNLKIYDKNMKKAYKETLEGYTTSSSNENTESTEDAEDTKTEEE